ncbi:MAG TPA: zinc ribbon domain-containing protein [Candidatus Omnitrophota bacterium]|nr:zinc ribbon domain-containing protein [Candidatus Omnitrophota bacterium]HPS37048.1 zinc ribbon domain-containing protein [Candidatus Omnitrophota bacterium]
MSESFDTVFARFANGDPVALVMLMGGGICIAAIAWWFYASHMRRNLPKYIKKHIELLLTALRKRDETVLMDPSLGFLARYLAVDLHAEKYGDPERFFWDGLIKFLKDVLKKHRDSGPEARLFSVPEIDKIISELDEMILAPGTVLCFECGVKILPDQDGCLSCGWDWKKPFACPECEAEMLPGQKKCASCGWLWK